MASQKLSFGAAVQCSYPGPSNNQKIGNPSLIVVEIVEVERLQSGAFRERCITDLVIEYKLRNDVGIVDY